MDGFRRSWYPHADPMPELTPEQVRHIGKLARLELQDDEVAGLAKELTSILGYVDMLREVNTEGVEPTAQVTGTRNALRPDELHPSVLATPDDLLAQSPLPVVEHQIETPSAHGSSVSSQAA